MKFLLFFFSFRISFFPCILLLLLLLLIVLDVHMLRGILTYLFLYFLFIHSSFVVLVVIYACFFIYYSNENQTRVHIKSMKFYFNEIKR